MIGAKQLDLKSGDNGIDHITPSLSDNFHPPAGGPNFHPARAGSNYFRIFAAPK